MNVQAASDFINEKDYVTLTEACREAGIERTGGEGAIAFDKANVYWAFGCTEEVVELVKALTRLGHGLEPVTPLVYVTDGEPIPSNMKMVGSRPPKNGYKHPRWAAMAFRKLDAEDAIHPPMPDAVDD